VAEFIPLNPTIKNQNIGNTMTKTETPINNEMTSDEKQLLLNSLRLLRRKNVFAFADETTRDRLSEIFGRLQQALESELPKQW